MHSNPAISKAFSGPRHQSGATLLVGLIVLALLTLLTVSSMSDMGIQTVMVRNNQLEMLAFNATLNELNAQIDRVNVDRDEAMLLTALGDPDGIFDLAEEDILEDQDGMFVVEGTVAFVAEKPLPGYSSGSYRGLIFEFDEQASLPGTGTSSAQLQGIYFIAPN